MPSKEPPKKVKTSSFKKTKASSPPKKKQKTSDAPAKASISSEFITESDGESDNENGSQAKSTPKAPVKATKEASKAPVKVTPVKPIEPAKDASKVPGKLIKEVAKAPVKANGSKTPQEKSKKVVPPVVAAVSSSEESSSEEGSSEEGSSAEEDKDESESGEEEEEEEEPSRESTSKPPQQQTPQPTATPEPSKPLSKFQVPKGFEPLPNVPPSVSATKIASIFSKTHLANKKVFHFTTPASVPISALERLKFKDIEAGKMSFSHNGTNYEVGDKEVPDPEDVKVMVMNDDRNYSIAKKVKIAKTLHFRQAIPSALITSSEKATVPQKRPTREQPEGLRVRFRSGEIGTVIALMDLATPAAASESSSDE